MIQYEFGEINNVSKFSDCADECVDQDRLREDLLGFEWDCDEDKCRCLYERRTLEDRNYGFDRTNTKGTGTGSIKKSITSQNWFCAKLKSSGNDVQVSPRALRGVN